MSEVRRQAEVAARLYLEMRGFEIIEQNFRRPHTQIDIIATKHNVVHFVQVNYYQNDTLTRNVVTDVSSAQTRKMQYGANAWIEETKFQGEQMLSTIEIAGPTFAVMNFSENTL